MSKEFVPYEQAVALKELGFNEPCFGWFTEEHLRIGPVDGKNVQGENEILAPTYSQAFRFFREKYDLNYEISYAGKHKQYHAFVDGFHYGNNGYVASVFPYEEAEKVCLNMMIKKVVKNR